MCVVQVIRSWSVFDDVDKLDDKLGLGAWQSGKLSEI